MLIVALLFLLANFLQEVKRRSINFEIQSIRKANENSSNASFSNRRKITSSHLDRFLTLFSYISFKLEKTIDYRL